MSDIQIYLIEADRNTSEAQYYAKKTAERKMQSDLMKNYHSERE